MAQVLFWDLAYVTSEEGSCGRRERKAVGVRTVRRGMPRFNQKTEEEKQRTKPGFVCVFVVSFPLVGGKRAREPPASSSSPPKQDIHKTHTHTAVVFRFSSNVAHRPPWAGVVYSGPAPKIGSPPAHGQSACFNPRFSSRPCCSTQWFTAHTSLSLKSPPVFSPHSHLIPQVTASIHCSTDYQSIKRRGGVLNRVPHPKQYPHPPFS
jgi:hypothetical protein